MKPAPFRYFDPRSTDEALALLSTWGDGGKILAGGQTLGPMMNFRLLGPSALIDINGVEALSYKQTTANGLAIGAMTRQRELEDDDAIAREQPLIAAAMPHIAHRAIRTRGTVGGSLSHADPAAEWGGLAVALDAEMIISHGSKGERTVAAQDFFKGLLQTAVEPDELLREIRIPKWPDHAGWSIQEFCRRHGDFALAGIACVIAVDAVGHCDLVRFAVFGVEPTPVRLPTAEARLRGEKPTDALLGEVAHRGGKRLADGRSPCLRRLSA
jgi:carbon-monoxide dehydrogenase medium subunit